MYWVKEVEIAKSIEDLFDIAIFYRMKRFHRLRFEEQRVQKDDLFLRGRQIASVIHQHFQAVRAYEAVQGLSDLFIRRLQNDDVLRFRHKMGPSSISRK